MTEAVSCRVAWVESTSSTAWDEAGGGEKEGVWVWRSSMSSVCHSPVGRSTWRCCWMDPPDKLEESRNGAGTPVLLPNRERSGLRAHQAL